MSLGQGNSIVLRTLGAQLRSLLSLWIPLNLRTLVCVVPILFAFEALHCAYITRSALCKRYSVTLQMCASIVALPSLQDVVGPMYRLRVIVLPIEETVAQVLEVSGVLGVGTAYKLDGKDLLLRLLTVSVSWCIGSAIGGRYGRDDGLVFNVDANFFQHLYLAHKQLMISLQGHMLPLLE